mmetsp:Transcript_3058/g.3601  ORF Transcript_3058/g.3601 Transcript_3058/m.3601 type:complete len:530 (-) Transcript_3058:285-1874(-)
MVKGTNKHRLVRRDVNEDTSEESSLQEKIFRHQKIKVRRNEENKSVTVSQTDLTHESIHQPLHKEVSYLNHQPDAQKISRSTTNITLFTSSKLHFNTTTPNIFPSPNPSILSAPQPTTIPSLRSSIPSIRRSSIILTSPSPTLKKKAKKKNNNKKTSTLPPITITENSKPTLSQQNSDSEQIEISLSTYFYPNRSVSDIIASPDGKELIISIGRSVSAVLCSDTDFYLVTNDNGSNNSNSLKQGTSYKGATLTNTCPRNVFSRQLQRRLQPNEVVDEGVVTVLLYDPTKPVVLLKDYSTSIFSPELQDLADESTGNINNIDAATVSILWVKITLIYEVFTIGKNNETTTNTNTSAPLQIVQGVANRAIQARINDGSLQRFQLDMISGIDQSFVKSMIIAEVGGEVNQFASLAVDMAILKAKSSIQSVVVARTFDEDYAYEKRPISMQIVGLVMMGITILFIWLLVALSSRRNKIKSPNENMKHSENRLLGTEEGLSNILDTGKMEARICQVAVENAFEFDGSSFSGESR